MSVSAIPTDKLAASLSGLRVAITGGTSGLGLALVRELLSRGARVAFVARTRRTRRTGRSRKPGRSRHRRRRLGQERYLSDGDPDHG